MQPLENDRALLEAFRNGERSALERVYALYSPEVARYLAKARGMMPVDLAAVHQETFIRAFRPSARAQYDGLKPYRTYLCSIARNTAVDLARASGRVFSESIPLEDAPELNQQPSEVLGPEAAALQLELRALVQRFLAGRPEDERTVARLRFIEELSQDEAARVSGLSRGEVRVRERRVRGALALFLKSEGWFDESDLRAAAVLTLTLGMLCLSSLGGPS